MIPIIKLSFGTWSTVATRFKREFFVTRTSEPQVPGVDCSRWACETRYARAATAFFERLEEEKRPPRTVRQEIEWLRETAYGGFDDHHWSRLTTIPRYAEKYRTGEFGWRQLTWDAPAPSFGSIAKTYILHPSAGEGGFPERVLSVRELLCIMGFSRSFRFPPRAPLSKRYHMVANVVSPVVAAACARAVKETLRT